MILSDDKKFINEIVTGFLDEIRETFFEIQSQNNLRMDELIETLEGMSQVLVDIRDDLSESVDEE